MHLLKCVQHKKRGIRAYKPLLGILFVLLTILSANGCTNISFVSPSALALGPPPAYLGVQQLQSDYSQDPVSADAKYANRRFYFGQVQVDRVEKDVYPLRAPVEFVLSGDVQFIPAFRGMLDAVVLGSIVEITGEVVGRTEWGYIVVKDCWIRIVSGGSTIPPGY